MTTRDFLLGQCARYTNLQPQDLLKALHQSVFGCGHFVTDEEQGVRFLREELRTARPAPGPAVELLDGAYCRVHLAWARARGLAPETLFRLFALSAEGMAENGALMEEKLTVLLELAREGALPMEADAVESAVADFREAGYPVCRHSQPVRDTWAPAYRVVRREYLWLLPLLAEIDRRKKKQRRLTVALEGGSASGKTTLSALLERIYDCTVFHMDDYFLQPEQRTEERLSRPGENIDHERFAAEILAPLKAGEPVRFRRFDCQTQSLLPAVAVEPRPLVIVEGAYSLHPELAGYYDLSAFLEIDPEHQRRRIEQRNTPEMQQRFFSTWIPLEHAYFDALDPKGRCDLVLEVRE